MIHATLKSRLDEDICLMLTIENHSFNYLCDCGFASDLSVKDCRDTAAIFVSHTHIDHFINFDHVVRHQLAIGRRVVVCGPAGIAKNVQCKLLSFNWNLLRYDDQAVSYEVREIHPNGNIDVYLLLTPTWELQHLRTFQDKYVFENEVFKVRYTLLEHGIDVVAYLFEEHNKIKMQTQDCPYKGGKWMQQLKQAYLDKQPETPIVIDAQTTLTAKELFQFIQEEQGFRLAYVMDYAATEENFAKIIALCQDIDELYIESYYGIADREFADKNRHSVAQISGQLAKQANVKKAIPIHFSRRYHEAEQRELLLKEFFEAFA